MNPTDIIKEYKIVLFRAKIISVFAILLAIPKLVIGFGNRDYFIGISSNESLALFIVGSSIYTFFWLKYWKCPACKKYPGGGWRLKECEKCGVCLSHSK